MSWLESATKVQLKMIFTFCPNYEELRNDTFNPIVEIDNINLKHGNKIELIFYAPTPQNGQAHSKYFSAV